MANAKFEAVTHPYFIHFLYHLHKSIKSEFICFRFWLERMHRLLYVRRSVQELLQPLSAEELTSCVQLWRELPNVMQRGAALPIAEEDSMM